MITEWKSTKDGRMGRLLGVLLTVVALAVLSLTCSGCWDRRELDESHHAVSLYLDWDEGLLRVTVEVLSASGEAAQAAAAKHVVISARGAGFADAMYNARLSSERPINLAHVNFIVFGGELARRGLGEVIDALTAHYQVRSHILVAVTPGNAHELLSAELTAPRHAEHMLGLLEGASRTGAGGGPSDLLAVQRDLANGRASDVVLAKLVLLPPSPVEHAAHPTQAGMETQPGAGGGKAEGEAAGKLPIASVSGAALFHRDRLAGFLERYEAEGLQWAMARIKDRRVWVPLAEGGGFSLLVSDTSPRVTASEVAGRLQVDIRVRVETDLSEMAGPADAGSPERVTELEALAARHIEEQIASGVAYAGAMKSDPLGVGLYLLRWSPDLWRRYEPAWPAPLAEADYGINVSVKIVTTGILKQRAPFGPK